jgi:hypothetical protein
MTQEELKLVLDALENGDVPTPENVGKNLDAITAIKEALAKEQEPVKIAHRHEWFRTSEMKVGQMRCISCGAWGQEEIAQGCKESWVTEQAWQSAVWWAEAKLKEKNT